MTVQVGDEWPVWWDTEDGREAGYHKARIIEIKPYRGAFNKARDPVHYFDAILVLAAPSTKKGKTEMAVCLADAPYHGGRG